MHEKLKKIPTSELAEVMGVGNNMAAKYKKEPWRYTPSAPQASRLQRKFKIPVEFWEFVIAPAE